MPEFFIELLGNAELVSMLAKAGAKVTPSLRIALKEEADSAFRRSQTLVPLRTVNTGRIAGGTLKNSGRVSLEGSNGTTVTITISYGGAASAYAWLMHKGTYAADTKHYTYHTQGTQSHYLSDAVDAVLPGMEARLYARISEILHV